MDEHAEAGIVLFGGFRFDRGRGLLARQNYDGNLVPVAIGSRALDILSLLIDRHGQIVSRDEILNTVWPGVVESANVTVQISALRRVVDEGRSDGSLIQTVSGRGYRFIGPIVTEMEKGAMAAPPQVDTAPEPAPRPRADAERRHITAMSCELIGISGRADGVALEDVREEVGAFQRCVSETVSRHDGFVASRLGNAALVLFGYPAAHEYDAEQAVRAGLELCAAVRTLRSSADLPMRCRVGIATGMAIIDDVGRDGTGQDREIIGDAPNLAGRLLLSVQPNIVAIDPATRRLIGNLFDCRDLDAIDATSGAEPLRIWQVLGDSAVASRFEAMHGSTLTPLVGRDDELDLLLRRWTRAQTGDGQVVLISGEPGIGKSRIAEALNERLRIEPHLRLRYFCSPYHQGSALHPFVDQLVWASGVARDDPPASKLEKLGVLLARATPTDADVSLLADLLSLPASEHSPVANLSPRRRKERTLEALIRQLEGLAHQQPLLIVFEDAHWIDPTSRELLDRTVEHVRNLPVLLIVTFRPEFRPPWTGQSQVTTLSLRRLGRNESEALVRGIIGDPTAVSSKLVDDIVERTDGVPLFLEELTRAVLETAQIGAVPPISLGVPATLHASLMARLDRLGSTAKAIAQVGAAVGREFSYELLTGVSQCTEAELRVELAQLVDAGLVFQRGVPPHATFLFKHALVQDAAYSTLLRNQRQDLHARIARVLEERFSDKVAAQPEILAQHYAQAGLVDMAIDNWHKAGERALRRSATLEAVQHLTNAIALTHSLQATPERNRRELDLHLALGRVVRIVKGIAAPETLRVFARARELLDYKNATVTQQISVLYGLWGVHWVRAENAAAHAVARQCLVLAARTEQDRAAAALANYIMGDTFWTMGNFVEARHHLEWTIDLSAPLGSGITASRFPHNHAIAALSFLAWTLWPLGYPQQAVTAAKQAVMRARDTGHVPLTAFALLIEVFLATAFGAEGEPLVALADETVAYCVERGVKVYELYARFCLSVALARRDGPEHAIEVMRDAIEALEKINAEVFRTVFLYHLAATHAGLGQLDVGLTLVEEALRMVENTGERLFEAELYRLRGELLLMFDEKDRAEMALEQALAIARRQHARMWELRAAVSLARLRRDQGRYAEARDLVAPIYGWFTEGFDKPDLTDARALLEGLDV